MKSTINGGHLHSILSVSGSACTGRILFSDVSRWKNN
jgi:hypothetical protein